MHRYSVAGHGAMLSDQVRVDAYARAIRECVRPGSVVVELGAGAGLFAILACRAGARRVYAIEADDIIELARENAAANGLADSIVFMHALSTQARIPEPADVIVSDLRGVLPPFEAGLLAVMDARDRFLAPDGRLIPASDRLMVALIEAPELYLKLVSPWADARHGVSLPAGRHLVLNSWRKATFEPAQQVGDAVCFAGIDYATVRSADLRGRARLVAGRSAVAHGLGMWFDTTLAPGAGFSTSPAAASPASVYGHAFFPFSEPLPLHHGDAVEVAIEAALVAGEYVWRWETATAAGHFRQSSFFAEPLSAERLRQRSDGYVADVGDDALIDLAILDSMRAGLPLGEIARSVRSLHPARFARWEDALARVGELSERYAR